MCGVIPRRTYGEIYDFFMAHTGIPYKWRKEKRTITHFHTFGGLSTEMSAGSRTTPTIYTVVGVRALCYTRLNTLDRTSGNAPDNIRAFYQKPIPAAPPDTIYSLQFFRELLHA